jgi:hypothetical protein
VIQFPIKCIPYQCHIASLHDVLLCVVAYENRNHFYYVIFYYVKIYEIDDVCILVGIESLSAL